MGLLKAGEKTEYTFNFTIDTPPFNTKNVKVGTNFKDVFFNFRNLTYFDATVSDITDNKHTSVLLSFTPASANTFDGTNSVLSLFRFKIIYKGVNTKIPKLKQELLYRLADSAVFISISDIISTRECIWSAVLHCNPKACLFQHWHIIVKVAKCHYVL